MTTATDETRTTERPTDLDSLEPLVGTWQVSGASEGKVRYEWLEGKYFMLQHVDLGQGDEATRGLEVIGHLRPYNEAFSPDIRSRYYAANGDTLDYTYEIVGDVLTIWMGERGSEAYYRGTFNSARNECTGAWVYPGGGGYESNMRRVSKA